MGKRTKFQVKELAQLTLSVNSKVTENNIDLSTHECHDLPKVGYCNTFMKFTTYIIFLNIYILQRIVC